jgi:hypothetical protein
MQRRLTAGFSGIGLLSTPLNCHFGALPMFDYPIYMAIACTLSVYLIESIKHTAAPVVTPFPG